MRGSSAVFCWLLAVSAVLGSCAPVPAPSVWKEEAYLGGPFRKLFIVGAFPEAGMRKLIEKEFAERFREQGAEAVASHTVLSPATVEKYETVLSIVRDQGCDGVIVMRSPGRTAKTISRTGAAAPRTLSEQWQQYYLKGFPPLPAYSWQREPFGIEADLIEVASGRPVWRGAFDITAQGPVVQELIPLAGSVVKQLRADRMIR